ncbi:MAG: SoxR reducing system RseC family protein [Deltaproteobacteria bacterium]|nr:SoxR reducing system RseC family protein [Deltaproteobacteria bacterium]
MDTYINRQTHMEEEGQVTAIRGGVATVETVQKEACAHCAAKGACEALGGDKTRTITALNEVHAEVGDRVMLAAPRKTVMGAGFLVYIVPVFALLLGAVAGKKWGPLLGLGTQGGAVLFGVAALSLCWLGLRLISNRVAGSKNFTIRVVKIVQKGDTDALDECSTGL